MTAGEAGGCCTGWLTADEAGGCCTGWLTAGEFAGNPEFSAGRGGAGGITFLGRPIGVLVTVLSSSGSRLSSLFGGTCRGAITSTFGKPFGSSSGSCSDGVDGCLTVSKTIGFPLGTSTSGGSTGLTALPMDKST